MQTAEAQNDVPKTEPLFDEDDIPAGKLDDAEIARLVSLSSKAAYSRTDNIPVKSKESFEPRTLVTIAMEAQRRREADLQEAAASEAASTSTSDDAGAANTAAEATDHAAAGDISPDIPADDIATDSAAAADVANDAPLQETGNLDATEPEPSEEEIAAASAAAELQAEYERGLAEGLASGEEIGLKAGHNKGYEAGRAAGQAEATAQLETAIQGFEKATLALTSSPNLDLNALTAKIHDAILLLASERAGMAIAEVPEAFAGRIETILATIKQGADHPKIILNPDDFRALKPIIATREKLQNCGLEADEMLASGDVRLVIDGIGIEDELHTRVGGKVAVQPADDVTTRPTVSSLAGASITDAAAAEANITGVDIVTTANAKPAIASSADDNELSESSASSKAPDEGGFSIGLKPKAETEDAAALAAKDADETKTDQ